ncbi:glycosyl hydrolase [Paraliobacillus sediminis]|uniref:glycosyl hydrolase n=1 Tax=Paraliobacillus sediminis TaxID=1885916 RepID=UPI000E3D227E|nr:glycosyl hydrolase [Paraliobacillus sediminis]
MRKKKKIFVTFAASLLLFSVWPKAFQEISVSAAVDTDMNLVDSNATDYTRGLFDYLRDNSGEQILFGQQHATDEGQTLTNAAPRTASEQSEVYNAIGDYPAIFGWDTGSIYGREKPGVVGNVDQSIENIALSMEKAHELGGIVTLSMHPLNPVTGGNYNDVSTNVVEHILPGGSHNDEFNVWLDDVAKLAKTVKDESDQPIPIIFRPFHEQDGSWFWWGASITTAEEYKAIFRYTVEYLRDVKDVNNILYGYSPGGGYGGSVERYLRTYPGNEYVDIFGIDSYDSKDNAGSDGWLNGLVTDLAMLHDLASDRGKIFALTEYGYSAQGMNETGNTLDWHTKVLHAIKSNEKASKAAYMQTWANFGWPNNMYVPYRDVNGDLGGDHELLPDFIDFKGDTFSAFRDDVKGQVYTAEHINTGVSSESSLVHVASPVSGSTIKTSQTTVRVRVLHDTPSKVVYVEEGSTTENEMTLDENNYYSAEWTPSAAVNNGVTHLTIKVTKSDGTVETEELKLFVKASEILIKKYTFDENIDAIKHNGVYPEGEIEAFEHADLGGDGKVKFQVSGMDPTATWQELKMELADFTDVNLAKVNRVNFEVLLPVTVGSEGASVRGIVQLPPDWDVKFGQESTLTNISDLEMVTIDGEDYNTYPVSIDLTDTPSSEAATSLAISLVGSGLDLTDAIYIDNIELVNTYIEATSDPLLIDDFEGYLGDNELLNNAYSNNGDPITIRLSEDNKNSGDYGLEYNYTVGSNGYAGRGTSLGNVDWSGANAFQFYIKNEALTNHLTVQIQMDGVSFEYNLDLEEQDGVFTIPFSDFAPAAWENKPNVVIDKAKLKSVTQFALYAGGDGDAGVVYLDDIKAVNDDNASAVPEVDETSEEPDGQPERDRLLYDFEEGLGTWVFGENENGASALSIAEDAINGSSLTSTIDLEGGKLSFQTSEITDLSGETYLSAKIKLLNGTSDVKLYIQSGGWVWKDSGAIAINDEETQTITWDLSNIDNLDNIQALGIEVIPTSGSGTTSIYVDDITLTDGTEEPDVEVPGTESPDEEEPEMERPDGEEPDAGEPETESPTIEEPTVVVDEAFDLVKHEKNKVYVYEKDSNSIKLTKATIGKLADGYTVELSNGITKARIPTSLFPKGKSIVFNFGEVSELIASKNTHALSELINFTITADGEEITDFGDSVVTLIFTVDPEKVNNWDNLRVVYMDQNGDQKEFIVPTFNEKTGEVIAKVDHFSAYGVFEIESESETTNVDSEAGEKLPDTATNQFNWLVSGIILLLSSIASLLVIKRKKYSNR